MHAEHCSNWLLAAALCRLPTLLIKPQLLGKSFSRYSSPKGKGLQSAAGVCSRHLNRLALALQVAIRSMALLTAALLR